MKKLAVFIAPLALFISACDPSDDPGVNTTIGGAMAERVISFAADRFVASGGRLPPPSSRLTFENETEFDLTLYSSLRSIPDVRVSLADPVEELPERLRYWTGAIESSGGTVIRCDTRTGSGLGGILGTIATFIARELLNEAKDWALYRPVHAYNAIIEMNGATDRATGVRFVRRAQFQAARAEYTRCDD